MGTKRIKSTETNLKNIKYIIASRNYVKDVMPTIFYQITMACHRVNNNVSL